MTLDEAIKHSEEVAEEQEGLYIICPASESEMPHCDGTKDCRTLKNGKNKGCQKCAEEHRQLAGWLKELKQLRKQTKKGHWIEGQTDNPKIHNILCSCCFEGYPSKGHANSQYTKKKFQYCPNCGAEMEGEE